MILKCNVRVYYYDVISSSYKQFKTDVFSVYDNDDLKEKMNSWTVDFIFDNLDYKYKILTVDSIFGFSVRIYFDVFYDDYKVYDTFMKPIDFHMWSLFDVFKSKICKNYRVEGRKKAD